jgi:hypothetical protein
MKNILFILLSIASVSCKPKHGDISGNVFWLYNNFIGNKADAGADVYLIPKNDTANILNTKTDLNGDFSFNNIEIGEYLISIISKNVSTVEYRNMKIIQSQSDYIDNFLGTKISQSELFLNDSIEHYNTPAFGGYIPEELATPVYNQLPFLLRAQTQKVYISKILVEENKTTKVIVDFGVNEHY